MISILRDQLTYDLNFDIPECNTSDKWDQFKN